VVGFLDALGLKQVDLAAGRWARNRAARRSPASERVRRLILFDSAGIPEIPKWDVRLFTPQTPAQLDQLDALLMLCRRSAGFIAKDIVRLSKKNAWVIHRAIDSMMTGQDATDKLLPELKMPVLLVWGGEDRITPLSQGETMHRLVPQSQLDVIPGCGHLAPRQCAAQIAPNLVAFEKQ